MYVIQFEQIFLLPQQKKKIQINVIALTSKPKKFNVNLWFTGANAKTVE